MPTKKRIEFWYPGTYLAAEEEEWRLGLISWFYVLADQYGALDGPQALPWTIAEDDLAERFFQAPNRLGDLLPHHDGWCFHPEWAAPRRSDDWDTWDDLQESWHSKQCLDLGSHLQRGILDLGTANDKTSDWGSLRIIEYRIMERSKCYRLLEKSETLLDAAIRQARIEMSRLEASGKRRWADCPNDPDAEAHALAEDHEDIARVHLTRAKLLWLKQWQDLNKIYCAKVKDDRKKDTAARIFSHVTTPDHCIKTEDVYNVAQIYDDIAVNNSASVLHTMDPDDALVMWYRDMLCRCGASDDDIRTMFAGNPHLDERRGLRRRVQAMKRRYESTLDKRSNRKLGFS